MLRKEDLKRVSRWKCHEYLSESVHLIKNLPMTNDYVVTVNIQSFSDQSRMTVKRS